MSDDRYVIHDQFATYFLTFTVVEWMDIFIRPKYKTIIIDSLNYCSDNKGVEYFAWVLMSNHLHLVARTKSPFKISDFIRDFKKYTSKCIAKQISLDKSESRRGWILDKMEFIARVTGRAENFKLWQDGYHAIMLENNLEMYRQKVNYIHQNPVRQLIVNEPAEYIFSSAIDYSGKKGLVKVTAYW